MDIRRINLSFNLANKDDREAYEVINKQRFKTNFVCKAVLQYINSCMGEALSRKDIKDTLLEVFKELDISKIDNGSGKNVIEENELPKEVFDMFSKL